MTTQRSLPDNFEVLGVVGQGEFTTVLHAYDRSTSQTVAVKVLPHLAWLTEHESRARRHSVIDSMSALTCLRHPNIASVYRAEEHGDMVLVTRDLAPGTSLRSLLRRYGTLPLGEVGWIVTQTARLLDALSADGLHHGGLSADNIIVDSGGCVVITDPGFAPAARCFTVAGVPCVMASPIRPETDITALAAVAFEALTGVWPLRRDGSIAQAYHLPSVVRVALNRALMGNYTGTASDFAEELVPTQRPALFRIVWQPAAAVGLLGAMATLGGHAFSESGAAPTNVPAPVVTASPQTAPPAPPAVQAAAAPTLPTLSEEERRVIQLAIRRQGPAALAHPAIAELFRLSEDQQAAIEECLAEQRTRVGMIVSAAADGTKTDTGVAMQNLRETTATRIALLLNDTQRALWESLIDKARNPEDPVL